MLDHLILAPTSEIASGLEEVHPADGARVLSRLPRERAAEVAEYLDPGTAASLFREMHPGLVASVIAEMEPPEASMVLSEMAPDDRVDILAHVPAELRETLILELDTREAGEVRRLASYDPLDPQPPQPGGGIEPDDLSDSRPQQRQPERGQDGNLPLFDVRIHRVDQRVRVGLLCPHVPDAHPRVHGDNDLETNRYSMKFRGHT
ncbi:MAG: hypothetical protein WBD40_23115 [Tepidisphaeraceae bacterium]